MSDIDRDLEELTDIVNSEQMTEEQAAESQARATAALSEELRRLRSDTEQQTPTPQRSL